MRCTFRRRKDESCACRRGKATAKDGANPSEGRDRAASGGLTKRVLFFAHSSVNPPAAEREPHVVRRHGELRYMKWISTNVFLSAYGTRTGHRSFSPLSEIVSLAHLLSFPKEDLRTGLVIRKRDVTPQHTHPKEAKEELMLIRSFLPRPLPGP